MKAGGHQTIHKKRPGMQNLIFPGGVLVIIGILFVFSPAKAFKALAGSGVILLNLLVPLGMVFTLMFLLNLFLKPAQIARFLGSEAGIRGVALSVAAGIISMGPIYAWYPLLKELKKKGVTHALTAVFLGSRAVKPFVLPVMISYFGWVYVALLILFTTASSLAVGHLVGVIVKE